MGAIDDLGYEIEFESIPPKKLDNFLNTQGINATVGNDMSCVTDRISYGNIIVPIDYYKDLNNHNSIVGEAGVRCTVGGEITTNILDSTEPDATWFSPVRDILLFLRDSGETPGLKSGIHIHICFSSFYTAPIKVLHGLLNLWGRLEAAIYRITAGELGFQRGEKHLNYCYYRPIVNHYGPQVIQDTDEILRPCLQFGKLLNARNTREFFMSLCRADDNYISYWAPKYHGLNFNSIPKLNTIELRTPNVTLNPDFLFAYTIILKRLVAKAFTAYDSYAIDLDRPLLPLGYKGKDFTLQDFIDILDIKDDKIVYILEVLWNITDWPNDVNGYQWSHLGYGIGENMSPSIPNFSLVDHNLIPDRVPEGAHVFRPDDFIER